jgi:hypothetical protein
MNPQEFVDKLKERFSEKGVGMIPSQRHHYFDTIKAFLQKKNLIVVSKVEYESLVEFKEKQYLKDLVGEKDFY